MVVNIHCVTVTGADDSIMASELLDVSKQYPFVEWGILFSPDRFGSPRFPSKRWLDDIADVAVDGQLALSAHLCGRFARAALSADWAWQRAVGSAAWLYGRVQINCGNNHYPSLGPMLREWPTTQRVIVQCSAKNEYWVGGAYRDGARFDILYDGSGGNGINPSRWPRADTTALYGYAGGLGPDNVIDQLPCISEAADGRSFWIDMETKVRSHDNQLFDLAKVMRVLKAMRPHFKPLAA